MGYYSEEKPVIKNKEIVNDLVGTGIAFPKVFVNGKVNTNTGVDRIKQSIYQILSTPIGSRFFLPEFGSRLPELVFEQNDFMLKDLARVYVIDAIEKWEKRITINKVSMGQSVSDERVFYITINYSIKSTSSEDEYIYPLVKEVRNIGGEIYGI